MHLVLKDALLFKTKLASLREDTLFCEHVRACLRACRDGGPAEVGARGASAALLKPAEPQ